jgi:SAM-dependent methyltransferase
VTTLREAVWPGSAYKHGGGDPVRRTLERMAFARLVPRLLARAGGGRLLDLGCGDGLVAELAGQRLDRYVGVDLVPRAGPREVVVHDLRQGLGGVGADPYDVYIATFGLASHLAPLELRRLLGDIAAHARSGSLVALEALGLHSLEWPSIWDVPPGPRRTLPYRLAGDVQVHPWSPDELSSAFERTGIRPLLRLDRTVQAGPKLGEGRYWPGLPPLREALNGLLDGDASGLDALRARLPVLPAHPAADFHRDLAVRRTRLLRRLAHADPRAVARAVWQLEPLSAAGLGHGLLVIGRVP